MDLEREGEEVGGVAIDTLSDAIVVAMVGTTVGTLVDTSNKLFFFSLTTGTETLG